MTRKASGRPAPPKAGRGPRRGVRTAEEASDRVLDSCYAFTGDASRVHRKMQALRRNFGRSEAIRLDDCNGFDAVDACRELGFESERVVIVDARKWVAADINAVVLYLMDPTPGTVLALWFEEIPRELRVRTFSLPGVDRPNLMWAWIDAWGERRQGRALDLLQQQLDRGDSPFQLLGMLASHVKTVIIVKDYAERGHNLDDIRAATGKHPITIQKAYRHSRRRKMPQLAKYLQLLAECDIAVKGGSRAPIEFELTRTMARLF